MHFFEYNKVSGTRQQSLIALTGGVLILNQQKKYPTRIFLFYLVSYTPLSENRINRIKSAFVEKSKNIIYNNWKLTKTSVIIYNNW